MAGLRCVVHYPHLSSSSGQCLSKYTEYSPTATETTSSIVPLNQQKFDKLVKSKEIRENLGVKIYIMLSAKEFLMLRT